MNRKRLTLLLVIATAFLVALIPAAVLAQDADEEGLLLRVNGPVAVGENETIDNVIVIGGDATVDGTVTGSLLVINGDATVTGSVGEDVTVIRGTLNLESNAQVENVSVFRGNLQRDAGATVGGSVTEGDFQVSPWDWGIFWAFIWMGSTLVVLVSGLIFAGIGGRQLNAAGDSATREIGATLLGIVVLWFLLPIAMAMIFFTIVGIPLSVGYFLFVLPIVWFLGYLVSGTLLGRSILRGQREERHPYLAALLGLFILQIIGIIPVFGGLVAFLAGVFGSGALIVLAWHAWRGERPEPEPAEAPGGVRAPAS